MPEEWRSCGALLLPGDCADSGVVYRTLDDVPVCTNAASTKKLKKARREQEETKDMTTETPEEALRAQRQRYEWLGMFRNRVHPSHEDKTEQDRRLEWAQRVAGLLRNHPTMPANPRDAGRTSEGSCWRGSFASGLLRFHRVYLARPRQV